MAWRRRAATLPAGKRRRKRRRGRLTGFAASELIALGLGLALKSNRDSRLKGCRCRSRSHLNRSALHAGDAERHPPVVNLVVRVVLEERVGDLRQAEPLVALHHQRHDADAVKVYCAELYSLDGGSSSFLKSFRLPPKGQSSESLRNEKCLIGHRKIDFK